MNDDPRVSWGDGELTRMPKDDEMVELDFFIVHSQVQEITFEGSIMFAVVHIPYLKVVVSSLVTNGCPDVHNPCKWRIKKEKI